MTTMNDSQRQTLRSIVHKCSHDETEFLLEQFQQAYGVTKEEHQNPWKRDDFSEALDVIKEQSETH